MTTTININYAGGRYVAQCPAAILTRTPQLQRILPNYEAKRTEYDLDCANPKATYLLLQYCAAGMMPKFTPGFSEVTLKDLKNCLVLMRGIGLAENSAPITSLLADIASDLDFQPDGPISESVPLLLQDPETHGRMKAVLRKKKNQKISDFCIHSGITICLFFIVFFFVFGLTQLPVHITFK